MAFVPALTSSRPQEAAAPLPGDWIAVASADHVARGVAMGIMQVGHGAGAPLKRVTPGSRVAYYSPTTSFRGRDRLQCFTALGVVAAGDMYQANDGGSFRPFRRNVRYIAVHAAPIAPLLDDPRFVLSRPSWGSKLRFGLLRIDRASMDLIADAMGAGQMAYAA
jgi:EVE domain